MYYRLLSLGFLTYQKVQGFILTWRKKMATRLTITIADQVIEDIEKSMKKKKKNNKSEFVEELIRTGLRFSKKLVDKKPKKPKSLLDEVKMF